MTNKQPRTRSASEILDRRHPPTTADIEQRTEIAEQFEVATLIHQARTDAGLSQRELAELVGTTASVICRLEDADYDGHSMAMLRRIAKALNRRVEVRMPPNDEPPRQIPA